MAGEKQSIGVMVNSHETAARTNHVKVTQSMRIAAWLTLGCLVALPIGCLLTLGYFLRGVERSVPANEVAAIFRHALVDTEVLTQNESASITGIQGFSQSDGFHGDGEDYYEAELPASLMAKLRGGLPSTSRLKSCDPQRGQRPNSPAWWPKRFSSDTYVHGDGHELLIIPPVGTRAYLYHWRS